MNHPARSTIRDATVPALERFAYSPAIAWERCIAWRGAHVRRLRACAEMLAEVRGLFAIAGPSDHIATSLARSRALLDELDEALLALSYDRDRAVFAQMAVLRECWRISTSTTLVKYRERLAGREPAAGVRRLQTAASCAATQGSSRRLPRRAGEVSASGCDPFATGGPAIRLQSTPAQLTSNRAFPQSCRRHKNLSFPGKCVECDICAFSWIL